MLNDNTFWLTFNESAYNTKLVLIISELRLGYTFKKLTKMHRRDVQVKIFLKNCKRVQK